MSHGGTEYVVSELSLGLSKSMDCQVITTSGRQKPVFQTNVPPIALCTPNPNVPRLIKLPYYGLRLLLRYISLVRQHRPDVILSTHPETNLLNLLTCRLLGVKSIISIHEKPSHISGMSHLHSFIKQSVCRLSGKLADEIVTVSEGLRDVLVNDFSIPKENIRVIYNPINIEKIDQMKDEIVEEAFFKTDNPIIVCVGGLTGQKGQWHLIRVFAEIEKKTPCKLVLCGSGKLASYYKSLVDYYNLEEKVLFTGFVENVYKYMRASDIFVSSSLFEGFGIVLVEAMECGCAVVASDCKYGPREVLGGGEYGLLCAEQTDDYPEPGAPLTESEKDMMNKITLLLNDTNLRETMSENGFNRAKEFKREIACGKYKLLIDKLKTYSKDE
ncbi:MAG: glycosyltransferase [Oscillospiraceae bacterium]|nr:glycosyltransferase [Oscillospiraceae bacterium]